MLAAAGAATVTFLRVVFSLLFLVVQFGSTTFTPRLTQFQDAPIAWRASRVLRRRRHLLAHAALVTGRDGTGSFT